MLEYYLILLLRSDLTLCIIFVNTCIFIHILYVAMKKLLKGSEGILNEQKNKELFLILIYEKVLEFLLIQNLQIAGFLSIAINLY